ncbi:MAG: BTAD domain-containing putative transcriptional regulator [Oscillospiraceae bacterium]
MKNLSTHLPIKIKLFGSFSITVGDTVITNDDLSNQLCNLIGFLVINRDKVISQDAIIDALWTEDISNPAAALKNLVYRFRKVTDKLNFPCWKDFIVFSGGSYHINNDLPMTVDVEKFELYCKTSDSQLDNLTRSELLRDAVECYDGDFMSSIGYKSWVVSVSQHYHSMYLKTVYKLLDMYDKCENYSALYNVAKRATDIDAFDETAHKYIIYALYKQGNQQQAINHFNYVGELFYKELGVELSDGTRKLYAEISKTSHSGSMNIKDLKKDLNESRDSINSAFYCELEVFKQLYRFEARSALRNGSSIFIGLFSIISADNEEQPEKAVRERAMEHLHLTIRESLRKGDAFTRCSPLQYALMLPMINYENSMMVLNRIDKRFRATFHSRKVILTSALQSLDPVSPL